MKTIEDRLAGLPDTPEPSTELATISARHTPLPWKWDGDHLWHFGESYDSPTDPHRYTGISIDKKLRDSPILKANMALVTEAFGEAEEKRTANKKHRAKIEGEAWDALLPWCEDSDAADTLLRAIKEGRIPHVSIAY